MKRFKNMGHTLGGYRCVTLEGPEKEKCLAGPLGELWYKGNDTYGILDASSGNYEKIKTCNSKDLGKWILRLKVCPNPTDQLVWANNPNSRLKD